MKYRVEPFENSLDARIFSCLVEARGVEPLSENTLERLSTGVVNCLILTRYKHSQQNL